MHLHLSILPQLRNELRNREGGRKGGRKGERGGGRETGREGIGRQGCMGEGGRVGVVV